MVVTMQDPAPIEELERQRAEFLGLVSHEPRAPLTSIKGSAATLLGASPTLGPPPGRGASVRPRRRRAGRPHARPRRRPARRGPHRDRHAVGRPRAGGGRGAGWTGRKTFLSGGERHAVHRTCRACWPTRSASSRSLQLAAWMSTRLRTAAPPALRAVVAVDAPEPADHGAGSHTVPAAQLASPAASPPSACPASAADPAPAPKCSCEPPTPPPTPLGTPRLGVPLACPCAPSRWVSQWRRLRIANRKRLSGRNDGKRIHRSDCSS